MRDGPKIGLRPSTPIASVEVVDPEVEKDAPDDRGLILDLLALHADGTRTNVEMQTQPRGATEKRALYHWARLFRDGLARGQDFVALVPCRVVFFLNFDLFSSPRRAPRRRRARRTAEPRARVHSTFRVLEVHHRRQLGDDLEIHFIEIPKLAGRPVDRRDPALDWARFLAAENEEERRRAAMSNPNVEKAREALERLSEDPHARWLAQLRADELLLQRVELAEAEERARHAGLREGRDAGLREGRDEGRAAALREAVRSLSEVLGLDWDAQREARVDRASASELEALKDALVRLRRWPD